MIEKLDLNEVDPRNTFPESINDLFLKCQDKINEIIDYLNNKESYENVLINNFVNGKREEKECFNCDGKGIIVETMRKDCDIKECPECNGTELKQSWQEKLEELSFEFDKIINLTSIEKLIEKMKLFKIKAKQVIEELIKDNEELKKCNVNMRNLLCSLCEYENNIFCLTCNNIDRSKDFKLKQPPSECIEWLEKLSKECNTLNRENAIELLKYFKEIK